MNIFYKKMHNFMIFAPSTSLGPDVKILKLYMKMFILSIYFVKE